MWLVVFPWYGKELEYWCRPFEKSQKREISSQQSIERLRDNLSCTIHVTPFPCFLMRSRAFPFILRHSFIFSISLLLRSVPLSVTLSHFHFRLQPWWARSTDWVPSVSHLSRAFPFILCHSFMFPLFSVSLLSSSVPLSITLSHFYFGLRPWWARSTDWVLSSVKLYFILLLFISLNTSVPFC